MLSFLLVPLGDLKLLLRMMIVAIVNDFDAVDDFDPTVGHDAVGRGLGWRGILESRKNNIDIVRTVH